MTGFILASGSPRRRELLEGLGLDFDVRPVDVDETPGVGEPPRHLALRLAREKAGEAARCWPGIVVLAADTLVVAPDGEVLGKPRDRRQAEDFLLRLAGRTHRVLTGVAAAKPDGRVIARVASTSVRFRVFGAEAARRYAETGEGDDKAGAYAIQGKGALLVEGIRGTFSNVVGLPLPLAVELLARAGAGLPKFPSSVAGRSRNGR